MVSHANDHDLKMHDIDAAYYSSVPVLNKINLTAKSNKLTVLIGPNGSGKSTCLRVMYGYLRPLQGQVVLGEENITDIYSHKRLDHGIAFLPQGRSVFPQLSVHENLEVGAWTLRQKRDEFQESLEATYERYPVLKELRRRVAGDLSGGQQRILEIARMMVPDPRILLIDEPTAGLAPILAGEVYEEIRRLNDEGRTILLVDQNVQAAVAMADYVYSLEYGSNHMQGERREFENQLTELVKGWLRLGEMNSD